MNGRVYDYNLGRFLSVDPFIQSPGNSQSMNPYSYIMNNPLAGTDPSGYIAFVPAIMWAINAYAAYETANAAVETIGNLQDGNISPTEAAGEIAKNAVENAIGSKFKAGKVLAVKMRNAVKGKKPETPKNETPKGDNGKPEGQDAKPDGNKKPEDIESPAQRQVNQNNNNTPPEVKETKIDRRKRLKAERKERKANERAPDKKVEWKNKQTEKKHGKDGKDKVREAHDKKREGEQDRSNKQIEEDYEDLNN